MTMFLLMFADIGQGIVILLIGWLTGRLYSKHPEMKDGIIPRSVCTLIEYVGIASIIGGILFGSNFGFPVPALWFNYHSVVMGHPLPGTPVQNIYDILGISIYYGLIVIFVGLGINWTNLIRKKNWIKLFFDRQGFSGVAIYIVGLYIGFSYTYSGFKSFPSDPWIAWVLLAAALGMLARRPLEYILDRKAGKVVQPFGPFLANALMMWLIELLETFTGYLSNTLSFFRVAGLGIAHVSLMGAFESLAEIPGLHSIGGIAILVAGNALVIALEGLSTGIQALRLNYYEFFTKFFNGTGIAYSPVSLRSKDRS
jgi:V/A-type H+-transporting ATPase subunit I